MTFNLYSAGTQQTVTQGYPWLLQKNEFRRVYDTQ